MKKIILILLVSLELKNAIAQKYITAAGVRFSNEGFGLSLQQRIFEHTTLEGIGQFNFLETSATIMVEKHSNLLFGKSLNTYAGIGPSVGRNFSTDSNYVGCNVVFGAEYKILLLPLVISADLKPAFRLQEDDWFHMGIGISFRYILVKQQRKKLFPHLFEKK